jgi:hypothetical protein
MRFNVKDMVKKAPKPEAMEAYGDDEESSNGDEDADTASARSAMEDYIKAVKSGNVEESLALFKELVGYC